MSQRQSRKITRTPFDVLNDIPVTGKLLMLVLIPLGITFGVTLLLIANGLNQLESDTSAVRLAMEEQIISEGFAQLQEALKAEAVRVSADPTLIEAAQRGDQAATAGLLLKAMIQSPRLSHAQIVDNTGQTLSIKGDFEAQGGTPELDRLNKLGLLRIESTDLVLTDRGWLLTTLRPLTTPEGQVAGVLSLGTLLNEPALYELNFKRTDPRVVLFDEQGNVSAISQHHLKGNMDVASTECRACHQELPDEAALSSANAVANFAADRGLWERAQIGQVATGQVTFQGRPLQIAYAPLRIDSKPVAAFGLLLSTKVTTDLRDQLLNTSLVVALAVVVLAALSAVVLGRRSIARPLMLMSAGAKQISGGQLDVVVPGDNRQDEIGALAATLNSMTAQLHGTFRELETRSAQLGASAEVGRAVTSFLEPDPLLKQVVELITERFKFYYTGVFTLDGTGQMAVLRAATGEAGRVLLERGHRLPVDEQSMVGGAIVTRNARIALDVGQEAVRFANPLLPNTRSEIALPLRVGDRTLGALDVQSEQAGAFDEASAETLQAMADQIAVALVNAESFNRSERQARTLALLNELSRNLATATSLEDVALAAVPVANSLLGQPRLAIVQMTANSQLLALRELTDDPDRLVGDPEAIQAADSLIGECVERREVIYTPDLSKLADRYSDVASFYRQGLRSCAILPLRVGERVLGTFNVSSQQIEAYSAEQINQLEQVASQLAVTIENLNLAEQTQQTLAELDVANRQLIGQAWGQYTRTTKLEAAEWHNGTWSVVKDRAARPETSQALIPAAPPLTLPIKVRGTTIGEFNIAAADAQQVWDTEEITFAQSLIDQVGQVLETARLLDETERAAQRERTVADAADKIHRSTDIESVLQSAVTELRRITGRNGISVQLGFGHAGQVSSRRRDAGVEGDR